MRVDLLPATALHGGKAVAAVSGTRPNVPVVSGPDGTGARSPPGHDRACADLPHVDRPRNSTRPGVWTPGRRCTPDRIRTGATALRGRRARPLHNGGMSLVRATRRDLTEA